MITVLCVDVAYPYTAPPSPILVQPVVTDANAWARAGNIEALSRYAGVPVKGLAYNLVLDEDGYQSSNAFFQYAESDEGAAFLEIPASLRAAMIATVADLLSLSPANTIVFISEENGHVTDADLTYPEMETIERFGPLGLGEFWSLVERHIIREDSLVIVTGD